jgi:two-component system chemotaxis sensor kinase CheA
MATDELKATFITETEDLLARMEESLLELETNPDDKEVLNSIFRVGHTVKGSAGLLNLPEIVAFTHVLENVLDRLRKSELRTDNDLISVLLDGKDVIAGMLLCVAEGRLVVETDLHAKTVGSLMRYADPGVLRTNAKAAAPPKTELSIPGCYRIELRLKEEIIEQGQDPYMLLLELADLGEILRVQAHVAFVPRFEVMDVYRCYLRWTVVLRSRATTERLTEVFVFVHEGGDIAIVPILDCVHWS